MNEQMNYKPGGYNESLENQESKPWHSTWPKSRLFRRKHKTDNEHCKMRTVRREG